MQGILMEQSPERHLECSECKKPISVFYTEIVGKMMWRIGMCADCPILRQKLYGVASSPPLQKGRAGLCCGNCETTADEIKMGASLGCPGCYEVFEDLLLQELIAQDRVVPKIGGTRKIETLHIGRLPGQASAVNPALQLVALHQALHETLSHEDYEQAAWLRDQIKALTEGVKKDEQGPQ
jgi:protein arginine kinase activator